MAYEDSAGLNVHNQYGPRTSGGEQGVELVDGYIQHYFLDLPLAGLYNIFPVRNNCEVFEVDTTFVTGTVTALAIGGVSVLAATAAAPVHIPEGNTGIVTQTGGTAGKLVIKFKNVAGDAYPVVGS